MMVSRFMVLAPWKRPALGGIPILLRSISFLTTGAVKNSGPPERVAENLQSMTVWEASMQPWLPSPRSLLPRSIPSFAEGLCRAEGLRMGGTASGDAANDSPKRGEGSQIRRVGDFLSHSHFHQPSRRVKFSVGRHRCRSLPTVGELLPRLTPSRRRRLGGRKPAPAAGR